MVTSKLLVRKEVETGKVLSQQLLFDDETTEHIIIGELPEIEEKEGFKGEYIVHEDGTVTVEYVEIPKTQLDIIQEQLNQLLGSTSTIMDDGLTNMEIAVSTEVKVTEIQEQISTQP